MEDWLKNAVEQGKINLEKLKKEVDKDKQNEKSVLRGISNRII